MATIEVVVSEELESELRSLAHRQGVSEREVVSLAIEHNVRNQVRPRPKSIGAGSDPDFQAQDTDKWLEKHFRPIEP